MSGRTRPGKAKERVTEERVNIKAKEERVRMAPNMGAGGSHPGERQEEAESKKEQEAERKQEQEQEQEGDREKEAEEKKEQRGRSKARGADE